MPKWAAKPASSVLTKAITLAALLSAIIVSLILHHHAGLTFPLPWPDESVFLWPAKTLAERGTWIAPQLNGARPILWMPPGYMVAMAAVFRWVPFTLAVARLISWVFSAVALAGLFYLHQRQRGALWSLPFLGVIAIAPTWVVLGNVARMEALLFLVTVWGFVLLASGRQWKGLALLALGPLIHPNGLVFLAAGIVAVTFGQRRGDTRFKVGDAVFLGMVALAYLGYGALILQYPEAFIHDMKYQFARKASSWSVIGALLTARMLLLWLAILAAALVSSLVWHRPRPSLWFIAASCTIPVVSGEMWYLVFGNVGILLLLAEWLDLAASIDVQRVRSAPAFLSGVGPWMRSASLVLVCAASLRLARWLEVTAGPHDFPRNFQWECMRMQPGPYLKEPERRAIVDAISRFAHLKGARRVGFDPPSDGLLLAPEHPEDYLPFFSIFSSETHDLLVLHITPFWSECGPEQESRLKANTKIGQLLFQYRRDADHRWYIFQTDVPPVF